MHSLLLKLKAPMQSWAHQSRFKTRAAGQGPTKSGILGLLAAAEGRRRSDPIEDLAELEFGVRIDQPGTLERDFQTAVDWRKGPPGSLVYRYYLSDAVFVAAVAGPLEMLEPLEAAVRAPEFPLFLGRRSCPANHDILLGIHEGDVEAALRAEPWHAADWYKKTRPDELSLPILRDAREGERGDAQRDIPLSYSPEGRAYAWREVVEVEPMPIMNPLGKKVADPYLEAVMKA